MYCPIDTIEITIFQYLKYVGEQIRLEAELMQTPIRTLLTEDEQGEAGVVFHPQVDMADEGRREDAIERTE